MKQGDSLFSLRLYFLLIFSLVCLTPIVAQTPLSLDDEHTVEPESLEEYSSVTFTSKNAHLIVEGTLIIYGDLDMSGGNDSKATFKDGSIVIVYGNVKTGNKVFISTTSHFIVYGNFETGSNSGQGQTDFSNGNVYIFGEVDDSWGIDDCDAGNDKDSADEGTCEYRTEADFLEDELPPNLQEALNCYNIPPVADLTVCENQTALLQVAEFADASMGTVTYQWQIKNAQGIWENLSGKTSISLSLSGVQLSQNGTEYRLVVKSNANCELGISNVATLSVRKSVVLGQINGPSEVCGTGPFEYSVSVTGPSLNYTWEIPAGWTVVGAANFKEITVIPASGSGQIKVTTVGPCGQTLERTLSVEAKQLGKWNGSINSLWEEPENWECGILPEASTNVLIPLGSGTYPIINKGITGTSNDISIEAGANLIVNGILEVSGSISAIENLNVTAGSLYFMGVLAQEVPLNAIIDGRIENLWIENPAGVTIEGAIEISGVLTAFQGDLDTNGNITLVSNANKTALISGVGTGQVLGDVTVQRFIDPAFGYKYVSSPIENATVSDFKPLSLIGPNNFPHFYRYNENRKDSLNRPATGWESYITDSAPLKPLEGYAANFGTNKSAVTVSFTGKVNNGTYSRSLTNNSGTYTKGFSLAGNPYPSPIDWNATGGWTKNNIEDGIYFFTADASDPYVGTYTSYVDGVSSDGRSSNIIPSMQGFFVHVSDESTSGLLEVNNEARVEDFSQPFLKSSSSRDLPLVRLSAGYRNQPISDPLVVYFGQTPSDAYYAKKEALKLMNTNPAVPSVYSLSADQKELSINAISKNSSEELIRIPLGIQLEMTGSIEFQLEDSQKSLSGIYVYLLDLERNASQLVSNSKSYIVQIAKGTHNKRFELVLSNKPLTDASVLLKSPFSAKATGTGIEVLVDLQSGQAGEISVSNLSGQILATQQVQNQQKILIEGITSSGVYIVTMKSGDSRTSKKILINK